MRLKKIRLDAGVAWNLLGGALPALIALLSISLLVIILPNEQFMLVSLMLSAVMFLHVYDFGFSRTLHYFQTHFSHSPQNTFLNSAVWLSVAVGSLVTAVLWCLFPIFVELWLNVEPHSQLNTSEAFQILSLAALPSVIMHVYKGYMEAQGAFKSANVGKIISIFGLFGGVLLAVMLAESLPVIAWVIVITRFFSLWSFFWLASTPAPKITLSVNADWSIVRQLLRYTGYAAFVGLVSSGFIYGDRFFVTGFIDATDYSIYVVAQDYLTRFLLLPWSLAMVLIPVINSHLNKQSDKARRLQSAYKQVSWLSGAFALVSVTVLIWGLPLFLKGAVLGLTQTVSFIILLGVIFGAYAQIPLVCLFSMGKAKLLCGIFASELVLYICIAPWIFNTWGVIGAATVWTSRLIIEAMLLNVFFRKAFQQL